MDLSVHQEHSQASGNPVKIGDGCATVTGYKLPQPLVCLIETGKAGVRFKPGVRISVWLCSSWLRSTDPTSPSKRRMRPARLAGAGWDSLNAFILQFAGV